MTTIINALLDAMDRFILRNHSAIQVGSDSVCNSHWKPRVRPWPCREWMEAAERMHARRTP